MVGLICIAFMSCNAPDLHYQNSWSFENGWDYDQSLSSKFTIKDTSRLYRFNLDFDHSSEYGYENIYLKIKTGFPDGKVLEKVFPIQMVAKSGEWLGNCRRTSCHLPILLQERVYFDAPGDYTLEIEQYTRENPLEGIHRIVFDVIKLPE